MQKDIKNYRKGRIMIGKKWLLVLYDLLILLLSDFLLLYVYDSGEFASDIKSIFIHFLLSAVILLVCRGTCKIYSQVWRYGGIQCYIRLLISDAVAFWIYYPLQKFLPDTFIISIIFIRALSIYCISLLCALSIRMIYRYAYKCCRADTPIGKLMGVLLKVFGMNRVQLNEGFFENKIKIAIVGVGEVGIALASELTESTSSAYRPVCFIDNDSDKVGGMIHSIPVLSAAGVDAEIITHFGIQEVVVALPRLGVEKKKELYDHYKALGCKVKVYDYPMMQQADDSKRRIREFDAEELLFRRQVIVVDEKTNSYYRGKTVLITGGGGSIGSELCRQIAKMSPKKLVILDVCENGAYDVQQELRFAYKDSLEVAVEILSICNRPALERVFVAHRPDIVINAAAHKHVPLMEHNCIEAIENNIFGTLNTVELSEKYGVSRYMMVSTDKAVNPTNVMGATKRMCEMIVLCHSKTSETTLYSATRFGNVLGSAGSVIPLFKRQIMNGGPITITDKRIIRYFMTIPEASQLVLCSGAMAKNGELFVLDMGSPVKILDLAESMIRLGGFVPYKDIDIVETGLRPGEKLYEELLVKAEELAKTESSLIFIERDEPLTACELEEKLALLRDAIESGDDLIAKDTLRRVIPTFKDPQEVNEKAEDNELMKAAV